MESIDWPSWPQYGDNESAAVERVVRSNQLFAADEVRQFENEYSEYLGVDYALGLGNATQGLHLALAALGVGVGDEVIVTPYSWISSASCVLMQNAVPVFCDIEPDTLGLDPRDVERKITPRTRAIILVHLYGYPSRVAEIAEVAARHGVPLIEDASHAHGASAGGQMLGSFGVMSVFSLHQRKALSVGDGGIVCTSDPALYEDIRRLRSFGHEELSYNYRMTEFAGALGRVGLRRLDADNDRRIENAHMLAQHLAGSSSLHVRLGGLEDRTVYYAVLLDVTSPIDDLDAKLEHLQGLGVPIRKTWAPLHRHAHFNPVTTPPRGLPWRHPEYDGSMKDLEYSEVPLPVVEHHCPDRVLELYVHPPAGAKEMRFAGLRIAEMLES